MDKPWRGSFKGVLLASEYSPLRQELITVLLLSTCLIYILSIIGTWRHTDRMSCLPYAQTDKLKHLH